MRALPPWPRRPVRIHPPRPWLPSLALAALLLAGAAARGEQPRPARALSLAEALALAEAGGETIRIAEAAAREAAANLDGARSGLRPRVDSRAAYTRTLASEFEDIDLSFGGGDATSSGLDSLPFGQENRWDLALEASQTLYAGGRVRAAVRGAAAGVAAAALGVETERAAVRLAVVTDYFDAALAERLLAIAESSLEQADRALEQARLAHSVGDAAEFDVLRAAVARDNQRPLVAQRRSDLRLALLRLRQRLGLDPAQPLLLTSEAPEAGAFEDHAEARAAARDLEAWVERRAPVRQAIEAVEARRSLWSAARGERLPSVSLGAEYGRVAYPADGLPRWGETRDNWTVGVGVALPLFAGGRLRAAAEAARARLEAEEQELARLRELAALEATQVLERLAAAEEVWAAARGSVEQARRAHEIAEVRYREGISTQLELDDARLALARSEANRAMAARDLEVARALVSLLADLPLGAAAAVPSLAGGTGLDPLLESGRSGGR